MKRVSLAALLASMPACVTASQDAAPVAQKMEVDKKTSEERAGLPSNEVLSPIKFKPMIEVATATGLK